MGREVSVEEIYTWTKRLQVENSFKRVEENIKFVFKLTLRHLRTTFFAKNNINKPNTEDELCFYKYYFGDLAKSLSLSLSEFFDPLNFKTNQKTLNIDFLKRVFLSSEFRNNFMNYLSSGQLKQDYQATIPSKIVNLLRRFERLMSLSQKLDSVVTSVHRYFRTNRQCKLPWGENEITIAVNTFISMFRK